MPHLKEDDRKKISSMLAHGGKCCDIAREIGCDPTTVAKEIKNNRVASRDLSKGQNVSSLIEITNSSVLRIARIGEN